MSDLIDKTGRAANPGDAAWTTAAARAVVVNRTHRVVRERARQMTSRRERIRSLIAPLAVSAALVVILVTAVWTLLDEYELTPTGVVDSSDQYLILLLWFLPVSAVLLAMVYFSRARRRSEREIAR
jgi:hypothetical protein